MDDDIFALSDEEQGSVEPTASPSITRGRLYPLSTDKSESKRKADTEAEACAADGKKRLRLTGTYCYAD